MFTRIQPLMTRSSVRTKMCVWVCQIRARGSSGVPNGVRHVLGYRKPTRQEKYKGWGVVCVCVGFLHPHKHTHTLTCNPEGCHSQFDVGGENLITRRAEGSQHSEGSEGRRHSEGKRGGTAKGVGTSPPRPPKPPKLHPNASILYPVYPRTDSRSNKFGSKMTPRWHSQHLGILPVFWPPASCPTFPSKSHARDKK